MHSVLLARWAHTVRMQSAHRAHMLKNPTNAQRVASARNEWSAHAARMQRACSAHAARMQRACSAHAARMQRACSAHAARMQRACSAHAARMQRALNAQPANGSGQMTVSIKSDGLSCLPSYRSREETRHTTVVQHANQERKCDVSESDEEDS